MSIDRSLVLGASGFVGRHLLGELGSGKALGTFHNAPLAGAIRFDALNDDIRPLLDEYGPFRRAYILLAESRIDRCAAAPAATYSLNVECVKRAINALHGRNILPVFASTDCVFDGLRGAYAETDAANPILTYGRQKREVERYLESSGAPFIIARLSKVVDSDPAGSGMLGEWVRAIRDGKESVCAVDQQFSPIDAPDVCRALIALGGGAPSGVYHVGGPRPWSRARLFEALVEAIRRHATVTPVMRRCGINDLPGFLERRPLDISMCSDRLEQSVGIKPRDLVETCAAIARAAYG